MPAIVVLLHEPASSPMFACSGLTVRLTRLARTPHRRPPLSGLVSSAPAPLPFAACSCHSIGLTVFPASLTDGRLLLRSRSAVWPTRPPLHFTPAPLPTFAPLPPPTTFRRGRGDPLVLSAPIAPPVVSVHPRGPQAPTSCAGSVLPRVAMLTAAVLRRMPRQPHPSATERPHDSPHCRHSNPPSANASSPPSTPASRLLALFPGAPTDSFRPVRHSPPPLPLSRSPGLCSSPDLPSFAMAPPPPSRPGCPWPPLSPPTRRPPPPATAAAAAAFAGAAAPAAAPRGLPPRGGGAWHRGARPPLPASPSACSSFSLPLLGSLVTSMSMYL